MLSENTKSLAHVVMYHLSSSVLFDVPRMPFHIEKDYRRVQ